VQSPVAVVFEFVLEPEEHDAVLGSVLQVFMFPVYLFDVLLPVVIPFRAFLTPRICDLRIRPQLLNNPDCILLPVSSTLDRSGKKDDGFCFALPIPIVRGCHKACHK